MPTHLFTKAWAVVNRRVVLSGLGLGLLAFSPIAEHLKRTLSPWSRIQVWTDSTGNGGANPREWPYLFADWLASEFKSSVRLLPWSVKDGRYGDPVVISDHDGPAITIANFAVPGATLQYGMGATGRVAMGERPDILVISLGLNLAGRSSESLIGEYLSALTQFKEIHPGVPVLLIKQNPFSDSRKMDAVYMAIDRVASIAGVITVDVAAQFESRNKEPQLYLHRDNTHPSQEGQNIYALALASLWRDDLSSGNIPRWNGVGRGQNLLKGPWVAGGVGTLLWSGYEMRASGGYAYLSQTLALDGLRGRAVTFAAKVGTEASAADGQGVIFVALESLQGMRFVNSYAQNPAGGGLIWRAIADLAVPRDTTRLMVGIYHDMAPIPSSTAVVVERAILYVNSAS